MIMNTTVTRKQASIDNSGLVNSFGGLAYSYKQIDETLLYSSEVLNVSMAMGYTGDNPIKLGISLIKIKSGDQELILSKDKVTLNDVEVDQRELLKTDDWSFEKIDASTYLFNNNSTKIKISKVDESFDLIIDTKDCKKVVGIMGNCDSSELIYNNGTNIDIESLTNKELNSKLNVEYGSKTKSNYNYNGNSVYLKNSSFTTQVPVCTFINDISFGLKFKTRKISNHATLLSYDKEGLEFSLFINSITNIITIDTRHTVLASSLAILPNVWYNLVLFWEADTQIFYISILPYGSNQPLNDVINVGFETVHACGLLTIGQRSDFKLYNDFNGYIDELVLWPSPIRSNTWSSDKTLASNYWNFDISNIDGSYNDTFGRITLIPSWKKPKQFSTDYLIEVESDLNEANTPDSYNETTMALCDSIYNETGCKVSSDTSKIFATHQCYSSLAKSTSKQSILSQLRTQSYICNANVSSSTLALKACLLEGSYNCTKQCVYGSMDDDVCICENGYWGLECENKCNSSMCSIADGSYLCDKVNRDHDCKTCNANWYGEQCSINFNHFDGSTCRSLSSNGYSSFKGLYFTIKRVVNMLFYEGSNFKIFVKQDICFASEHCINQMLVKFNNTDMLLVALNSRNKLIVFSNGNETSRNIISNQFYNLTIYKEDMVKIILPSGESILIIGNSFFIGISLTQKSVSIYKQGICFRPDDVVNFDTRMPIENLNETYLNNQFVDDISVDNTDFMDVDYNGNHDRCLTIESGYLITHLKGNQYSEFVTYQLTIKLQVTNNSDIISMVGIDALTIYLNNMSLISVKLNNNLIFTSNLEILKNMWYSLSFVVDSKTNTFSMYSILGEIIEFDSTQLKYNSSLNTAIIIGNKHKDGSFIGDVNDFRIWDRLLTRNGILRSTIDHDIVNNYSNVISIFTFDEIDGNGVYYDIIDGIEMHYKGNMAKTCYVTTYHLLNEQKNHDHNNETHLNNLCNKYMNKIHKICSSMPVEQKNLYILECQRNMRMLPLQSTLDKSGDRMALTCNSEYNTAVQQVCRQSSISRDTCNMLTRLEQECQFGEYLDGKCSCDRGFWNTDCSQKCMSTDEGSDCLGICDENDGSCLCQNLECKYNESNPINLKYTVNNTLLALFGYGNVLRNDSVIKKITSSGIYKLLSFDNIHISALYIYSSINDLLSLYSVTIENDDTSKQSLTINSGASSYSPISFTENTISGIQVQVISTFTCEIRFLYHQNFSISIYKTDDYLNMHFSSYPPHVVLHSIFDNSVSIDDIYYVSVENIYTLPNIQLFPCHSISSYRLNNLFGITPAEVVFEIHLKPKTDQGVIFSYTNINGKILKLLVNNGNIEINVNGEIIKSTLTLTENIWTQLKIHIYPGKSYVGLDNGGNYIILNVSEIVSELILEDGFIRIGSTNCLTFAAQYAIFKIKSANHIISEWTFVKDKEKMTINRNMGLYNLFLDSSYNHLHEIHNARELVPFKTIYSNLQLDSKIRYSISLCIKSLSLFNNSNINNAVDIVNMCNHDVYRSNGREGSILALILVLNEIERISGLCNLFSNYPILYGQDCARRCFFRDFSSTEKPCQCLPNYKGDECNSKVNECAENLCKCPLNREGSDDCKSCSNGFKGADCSVLQTDVRGRASFINGGNVFTLEGLAFFYRSQDIIYIYSDDFISIYGSQVNLGINNIQFRFIANKTVNFILSSTEIYISIDESEVKLIDLNEIVINSQFHMHIIDTSVYRLSSSYLSIEIHVYRGYMNLLIDTKLCNSNGLLGCSNLYKDFIKSKTNFKINHFIEQIESDIALPSLPINSLYLNHSTSISNDMAFISNTKHFTLVTNCLLLESISIHTIFTYVYTDNSFITVHITKDSISFTQKNTTALFYINIDYNEMFSLAFSYNDKIHKILLLYKTKKRFETLEQHIVMKLFNMKGKMYLGGSKDIKSNYEGIIESMSIWNNYYTISGLIQKMDKIVVLKDEYLLYHWTFDRITNRANDFKRDTSLYVHPASKWIQIDFSTREQPISSYQPYPAMNHTTFQCKSILEQLFSSTCSVELSTLSMLVCEEALGRVKLDDTLHVSALIYDAALLYKWNCPAAEHQYNELCNAFPAIEFPIVGGTTCNIPCIFGEVKSDRCECFRGYFGDACDLLCKGGVDLMCSGHGICTGSIGDCSCVFNWNGL